MIKAIVFDAYGTLLDVNALDHILAKNFGEKSVELSITWRKKQLEYTWLRTLMKRYCNFSQITMDALEYSCKVCHLQLREDLKNELNAEYLRLKAYPEVPKILQAISEKVRMGVLSNANHDMLQSALSRNDLGDLFEHILSAEDIRLFKPRPEIYQMAVDKFALEAHEILFVSSNTWDVSGAKSFGLTVAWLNRNNGIMEQIDFEPDFMVESMEEIQKIIGE